jgi:L-ascorbate metabolism protein UlaG (beta-lactamase superfamily)
LRALKRALVGAAGLVVLALCVLIATGCEAFGARAKGARLARMSGSPEWHQGRFENPEPLDNHFWQSIVDARHSSPFSSPQGPLPVSLVDRQTFVAPPPSGLRVTWFGHSSVLLEIEGHRILTDPVWSERASPYSWIGPRRFAPPLIALQDLPQLDAVVISHDHYDHLDQRTIQALASAASAQTWKTVFVVPLGVGAHLVKWGIPEGRIVELDWWQETSLAGLRIVCTPARHASGRMVVDGDAKLWAGYAFIGSGHRVYYSGDTGLFPAMRDIGSRLGPFDLTMIEAGQYGRGWPDWHLGPEQAVRAHQWVRGKAMLPVHWAMFQLAYHGWTEPIERVLAAAKSLGVTVLSPRVGQSIEPSEAFVFEHWWPSLPWKTAAEDPIVATGFK